MIAKNQMNAISGPKNSPGPPCEVNAIARMNAPPMAKRALVEAEIQVPESREAGQESGQDRRLALDDHRDGAAAARRRPAGRGRRRRRRAGWGL